MAIDVVVYVSSVANPKKHTRKIACLESFAAGVAHTGHRVHIEWAHKYRPSRLAVMLGWATTNTGGSNITLRKEIIAQQHKIGFKTMCIDSSCWKYIDTDSNYLRYSLGGPFYDRGEYANNNSNSSKWLEIKQALNVELQLPQTTHLGPILICMQRDGGFAMKTLNPLQWLSTKIEEIRRYSQRQIVIRPHPGDYNPKNFVQYQRQSGITVVDPLTTRLMDNLNGAHAAVFFNSSASVAAVLAGVPVFADDSSCVAWKVANQDIAKIESPETFARDQWLYDLSAAHWSDADARSGRVWQKFLPYLASTTTS